MKKKIAKAILIGWGLIIGIGLAQTFGIAKSAIVFGIFALVISICWAINTLMD